MSDKIISTQEQLDAFRQMVVHHDLTYNYSDDHRAWRAGTSSYNQLVAYAKENLERSDAVAIWNEIVDTKIVESSRQYFYWKE